MAHVFPDDDLGGRVGRKAKVTRECPSDRLGGDAVTVTQHVEPTPSTCVHMHEAKLAYPQR